MKFRPVRYGNRAQFALARPAHNIRHTLTSIDVTIGAKHRTCRREMNQGFCSIITMEPLTTLSALDTFRRDLRG